MFGACHPASPSRVMTPASPRNDCRCLQGEGLVSAESRFQYRISSTQRIATRSVRLRCECPTRWNGVCCSILVSLRQIDHSAENSSRRNRGMSPQLDQKPHSLNYEDYVSSVIGRFQMAIGMFKGTRKPSSGSQGLTSTVYTTNRFPSPS